MQSMDKTTNKKEFVAKALLFDQLTSGSEFLTGQKDVVLYLTKEQLFESIQKEVSDILNTRSSYSSEKIKSLIKANEEWRLSGIEGVMGLPSLRNIFVEGGYGLPEFARQCEAMIRMYEPRIQNPCIEVSGFNEKSQCLSLIMRGNVQINNYREHVSFTIRLGEEF
ncbi:MAG: type VI secretion system baseplate subunit TssE [Holosporales bacterium]|jgi:type VI secretion system lysozyme-like protein|nr:type VI secretion system baseplate subunit TssE [Holosporales bacterium]